MVGPVWWLFRRFSRKKNLLRVAWGADHQQYPNSTFGSMKASMFANPATMEAFRVSKVLWWVLLRVHSQSPKKIGVAEVRGSSTGTTITILTPWRPPWWRGLRTCPGKRLRFCWWTAPPCNPLDYYFFESLRMNHQQEPPKHFGLPEGLHGGPIPEHAQGGDYARLVPLPYYNPVCHRSRGWLHLFFFVFILFYILLSWNTRKIKKKTLFLSVWERNSFCANLPCRPCICS